LAQSPALFLETLTELNGGPLKLEPYQIRFLNDHSNFRIVNKSRQIGFSTVISGEGFAKAIMNPGYRANYVSVNQTEASDKIEIARNLYHSISDDFGGEAGIKPVLWNDSEQELSFHRPPNVATMVSQPASSAIRGGRKDIYFDEFAHIRDAKKLYQAAIPAITRGDSRLTIVSTPLGQSGLFYDIASNSDAYPEYSRHSVPWWECQAMVKDGFIEEAIASAADMGTAERVQKFGTPKLLTILRSFGGDLQSFATEYEATFVDETSAYYPWELIVNAVDDTHSMWRELPPGWEPQGSVAIGVDLAKERDESVFTVVEFIEAEDGERTAHVRLVKSSQDTYDSQLSYLLKLIKQSKATRVSIDQTGVGAMFVESAKSQVGSSMIEGVVFTNAIKERWATKFKGELQGVPTVRYPRHSDLMRQIHGIRRTKSEAGFYKFSGGSGAKRDDYFWSLCLALYGHGRNAARMSFL